MEKKLEITKCLGCYYFNRIIKTKDLKKVVSCLYKDNFSCEIFTDEKLNNYVKDCPLYDTKTKLKIKIKLLHKDAKLPIIAHFLEDSGADLYTVEDKIIEPKETKLIHTGISVELPLGYELQIRPRSGNSLKTKLRIANSPGTIDAGYRGEIGIICDNISDNNIVIPKGTKIAQMILCKVENNVEYILSEELNETNRKDNGFGSTK